MNVLIVCQYFDPEEFRVNDLVVLLEERGHSVIVVTGKPNYPSGRIHEAHRSGRFRVTQHAYGRRSEVIRVPLVPRGERKLQLAMNFLSFAVIAATIAPVAVWRKRKNIDVILTYQLSPVLMALPSSTLKRVTGARIVHWIFDLWPESLEELGPKSQLFTKLFDSVTRFVYRDAAKILIQSPGFESSVRSRCNADADISYLPSWGEDFFLSPAGQPADLPGDGFKIVFAGNVGDAQGLETLIDAATLTHQRDLPISWIILGEGRALERVKRLAKTAGLESSVYFLPRVPVEEVSNYLSAADALYVGLRAGLGAVSLTIPSKVQTYLASGRPILGALDGPARAVVAESGAGFCVAAGDAAGLAIEAETLASSSAETLLAMSSAGQTTFRRDFSEKSVLDRLEKHLREAAKAGHALTDCTVA